MNKIVIFKSVLSGLSQLAASLILLFTTDGVKTFSDVNDVSYAVAFLTAVGVAIAVLMAALSDSPSQRQSGFARLPMLVLLLGVSLLALIGQANAATAVFNWSHDGKRANGSTLDAGELKGFRLYGVSASGASPSLVVALEPTQRTTTISLTDPAPGQCITYYFAMTSVSSSESALSAVAALPLCPPAGVSNFGAQYQINFIGK